MGKTGRGRISVEDAVGLLGPRDAVWAGLATGQPVGFLRALGARTDFVDFHLYMGIMAEPYALLQRPGVRVMSGFFGPIERMARAAGSSIEYVPSDFQGFERLGLRLAPRAVVAPTTPPDADGWLSFGLHAGATDVVFRAALADPDRLALAEVNPRMPRVAGLPELGGHRVHVSEVDGWWEHDTAITSVVPEAPTAEELAIAGHVAALVPDRAILQFGIGGVPDGVARILATGARGGFAIHTEMVGDGVMHLHRAGKVTNRKPLYDGVTVGTFALGSAELYAWLDGNPDVRLLPVSATNEPALLRRLPRLMSVNAALMVDLTGQVLADHLPGRQYSGVGGHESFVIGASEAPEGKSFVCLKSTAMVNGVRVSTIVPRLPEGATVTTPRHHVQYVVTEHGAVDLSALGDVARPRALVGVAHPDFRDVLSGGLSVRSS